MVAVPAKIQKDDIGKKILSLVTYFPQDRDKKMLFDPIKEDLDSL